MPSARKEIPKLLSEIRDRDYYTVVRDFFELSAISIRNTVDLTKREEYEQRYNNTAKKYRKEQMEVFASFLGLFMGEINAAINGSGEQRLRRRNLHGLWNKQRQGRAVLHALPVSHFMAECTLNRDEVEEKFNEDPDHVLTLYEPTCGAGGLIVASIDVLNRMGVNYAWNVFVDCGDIDPRCVHMTYLTLSLLGVPAVVRLGDALMMDYREAWFTPAYLFAWPHFKNRIGNGKYPTSPTVRISNDSEKSEKTIIIKEEPQILQPVPQPDENGQYSLFFL